ncbi:MAG: class II aldolase/adducin family protein [Candidatus Krumholzibacteria bacterium]|nr:class II aldolase/adducin family protein [Candidatus Krumholzibacteria bacterium]
MEYLKEGKDLAEIMGRLCAKDLTTSTGGNASLRVDKDSFLITPSGKDKNNLTGSDIILISSGKPADPAGAEPSMETGMHSGIYEECPGVTAIIHAHPLFASAYSVTGREIRLDLTGESRALLGRPAIVPYALMGSETLATSVAKAAKDSKTLILANHGAVTTGSSLQKAFSRMELLEMTARLSFITEILGDTHPLSRKQLEQIDHLFR